MFGARDAVAHYSKSDLQAPERMVLESNRDWLAGARMLDIGVGAGRTTHHFAPAVESYLGGDVVEEMVARCREIFGGKYEFKVMDVCDLSGIPDSSVEFVLFSFNGLDHLDGNDRLKALKEILRVLVPGGLYCFSSHNLRGLSPLYRFKKSFNPFITLKRYRKYRRVVDLNGPLARLQEQPTALVHDGAHDFRIRNFYITVEHQIAQLHGQGFGDVRVHRLSDGMEVDGEEARLQLTDPWIYYTCRKQA